MRNFMEAYAAVHNPEAKKEFYSNRDPISEMNTASLTDNDLREIAEEICEELFAQGYGIQEAADVLSDVLAEGENSGRNAKISRLFDAFAETFNRIQSKANQLEAFAEYRNSKRLQETWSARFNQEKRIKRHHGALVAEHVAGVKRGLLQMVELYKGKHGQSDKEYADSRSQGGKMVSGDSKMSGAEYTHGRRVKAANPGMQPDVGGKTKPKSQGKMDRGTRADIEYRKANLKKEELEVTEGKKAKPDYLDFDGDGNEKESMKKALKDKKRMKEQLELTGKFSAKEIEELIEKL